MIFWLQLFFSYLYFFFSIGTQKKLNYISDNWYLYLFWQKKEDVLFLSLQYEKRM